MRNIERREQQDVTKKDLTFLRERLRASAKGLKRTHGEIATTVIIV